MKNNILKSFFVVILLIVSSASSLLLARDVQVFFSPKGGAQAAMKAALLSADRSIDIAMYNFSSQSIFETLRDIKTERPNVKIRLLFDKASDASKEKPTDVSKAEQSQKLEDIGVDVRYVTKTMHHKFFIVDGYPEGLEGQGLENFSDTILFTGSGNFSDSADRRYDENYLEVKDDPYWITQFQKEYQLLWAYSYDFPSKEPFEAKDEYEGEWEKDSEFQAFFTSDNFKKSLKFNQNGKRVASSQLEEAISHANNSIYVAADHFRFVAVAQALVNAKKNNPNLDIRVITDGDEYATETHQKEFMRAYQSCLKNSDEEECLRMGGYKMSRWLWDNDIQVRSKYFSYIFYYALDPQMHDKYIVIDQKDVWTGSYNYSISAEFNTFENLMHIPGTELPDVAKAYVENFKNIWDLNRDNLYRHKRELKTRNRIPLHFTPMALSMTEIDGLLSTLNERVPGFFNIAKPEHVVWDVKRHEGETQQ